MVEASAEKERKAKETIQQLTKEISVLTKLVDHGAGISTGKEAYVDDLIQQRDDLIKERDQQQVKIASLHNDSAKLHEQIKKLNDEKRGMDGEIKKLQTDIQEKTLEYEREHLNKKQADATLREKIAQTEALLRDLEMQKERNKTLENELKQKEAEYAEQCRKTDALKRELANAEKVKKELEEERNRKKLDNEMTQEKIKELDVRLKQKENELNETRLQQQRYLDEIKSKVEQIKKLHDTIEISENHKIDLEGVIKEKDIQIKEMKKELDRERARTEDIQAQRNILIKKIVATEKDQQDQKTKLDITNSHKENMEQQLQNYRKEAERQRRQIYQLEKEREKYAADAGEATQKYYQALEEVKIKTLETMELQKKISEGQEKLKQQQALYESVRSDRNMYSKALNEANEEIEMLTKKFKVHERQIEQLKEEIANNNKAIVAKDEEVKKEKSQVSKLKEKLEALVQAKKEQKLAIEQKNQQIAELNKILKEADLERKKQLKDLESVQNDRDILGTQLIRRNDELALLYEKIKIQQSALNKGATQYRDRCADIKMLKGKIDELRTRLITLKKKTMRIQDYKTEIHQLQRQLIEQKTKVKALSEQLENPMNVHRWRKLEGSDPTAYEMILKIQTLQKRLIQKTEEVMEKDLLIQEKERLYVELKNILARQPGPEVADQLNIYQETLRKKAQQMKTMSSELNMYMFKVKESRYESDRLNRELNDTKNKYFDLKKREQQRLRSSRQDGMNGYPIIPPSGSFAGGGFNINMTAQM